MMREIEARREDPWALKREGKGLKFAWKTQGRGDQEK
jgi:hypothetical protein